MGTTKVNVKSLTVAIDDVVHGALLAEPCSSPNIYCHRLGFGEDGDVPGLHMHDEREEAFADLSLYMTNRVRGAAGLWKVTASHGEATDPVLANTITCAMAELEELAQIVDQLSGPVFAGDEMNTDTTLAAIAINAEVWRGLIASFGTVRSATLTGRDAWLSSVYDSVLGLFTMFVESNRLAKLAHWACAEASAARERRGDGFNVQ